MDPLSHRRQVLLFFVAVILPSIVLVVLSLRMISQETELAENRAVERRERVASDLGQQLLVRLERIKLDVASEHARELDTPLFSDHPAVAILGRVEEDRLVLPWDIEVNSQRNVDKTDFHRRIQEGEAAEFARKRPDEASRLYEEALEAAQTPTQSAFARLLLARSMMKEGRVEQGGQHFRSLLQLSPDIRDEHAVPVSFYAAGRLLEKEGPYREILHSLQTSLTTSRWLSPMASLMLAELTETLVEALSGDELHEVAQDFQTAVQKNLRDVGQFQALQDDFPNLVLIARRVSSSDMAQPLWMPYGEDSWLVSVDSSLTGKPPLAAIVRAGTVWASMIAEDAWSTTLPGEPYLLSGRNEEGYALGPSFPDLRVTFTAQGDMTQKPLSLQFIYYLVALLLVLSITLFGAYLLWRDVQRELNLAAMRSQFVASVSHELKTPLTAIRMFAETLRLGRSEDPQVKEEFLGTIVSESERLTRLLNNVLDFSKIEQGTKSYTLVPTSLAEVVQASARAMRYPLSQEGFELSVDVTDDLPLVSVDRDAIEQAILNLLANALKYSGEHRKIDLRLFRQNGEALIQVKDGGIGVDPDEQSKIFEKFYRPHTPENESLSGTGLGLALVDHIVKAHGGRVDVESVLGQGSTFSIRLPLERPL